MKLLFSLSMKEKIIAAFSTPDQKSAVAVLRISGAGVVEILSEYSDKKNIFRETGKLSLCGFVFEDKLIDKVMMVCFRAPHSYTGEDVVEIHCHGSRYIKSKILESLYKSGIMPAGPGEFTKRAFLNGKLNLIEAESVMAIIGSESEVENDAAQKAMSGNITKSLEKIRENVLKSQSAIELELDFSEENIGQFGLDASKKFIDEAIGIYIKNFDETCEISDLGKGVKITLTGHVNAGKSSLFNRILGEERSIIHKVGGTTRDRISETVNICGLKVSFSDTAGIRRADDEIEIMGIDRARQSIEQSDVVIAIFDGSAEPDPHCMEVRKMLLNKKTIYVVNKIDKGVDKVFEKTVEKRILAKEKVLRVSAKNGEGFGRLLEEISGECKRRKEKTGNMLIAASGRQKKGLENILAGLKKTADSVNEKLPEEIISETHREVIREIDLLTGRAGGRDVLDEVFSSFCIGK
ncbi:MAG: tRNA uridine-5-carboxymethylaminomethyl(34) synthesis GTPase MnmE [Fibrobacterota bacterium]